MNFIFVDNFLINKLSFFNLPDFFLSFGLKNYLNFNISLISAIILLAKLFATVSELPSE